MSKRWILITAVLVLVVAGAAVALAQDDTDTPVYPRGMGMGMGMMYGPGGFMLDTAAEALGLESADLLAKLQSGLSVAQVAEEQGTDLQVVVDAITAAHNDYLASQVEAGYLTQAQADFMQSHMTGELAEHLSQPFGAGAGFHGRWGTPPADGEWQPPCVGMQNMPGAGHMGPMGRGGRHGGGRGMHF